MLLELKGIDQCFGAGTPDEMRLFSGFDFSLPERQFVSIVGSNGSGKTTLLNLICGAMKQDAGRIFFHGREISSLSAVKRAGSIGRVFQDPKAGTCGDLTILENLALADNKGKSFGLAGAVQKGRRTMYRDLLARCGMGLENRLDTPAGALSGGQRQALALVIATMTEIELLILDEHTAALDPKSSETIMELTQKLITERGIATIMVTHNLRHAVQYGDRLVMMHQGKIIMDRAGEEKRRLAVDDLLGVFTEISVECGN